MGKHTKKGAQKSSVDQFGHTPDSAYAKSRKMAKAHEAYQEKAEK